jgi:proteic killer suppression protein
MKRGHLMKEEISVYFRMAFQGRALRGRTQAPHGWEAENARHYGRLQRGKGGASFPKKYGNDLSCLAQLLTSVRLQATVVLVRIRNFIHKGLKRLYADDATKGVPPDTVDKLRKMLAFLDDMDDPEELRMLPSWKTHTLTGDRKGAWSLSVTANRRLTFRLDTAEREIYDVNLEDYH